MITITAEKKDRKAIRCLTRLFSEDLFLLALVGRLPEYSNPTIVATGIGENQNEKFD